LAQELKIKHPLIVWPAMQQRFQLLIVVLLCFTLGAQACGPLRVALRVQPGVYERMPDGSERGVDVDLVQELAVRSGCRLVTQEMSNSGAWKALAQGDLDLLPSATASPDREAWVDHVPVIGMRLVLLVRGDVARRLGSFEQFNQDATELTLKVRGGSVHPEVQAWFARLATQNRVTEAGDVLSALRAFELGRAAALPIYPMLLRGRGAEWLAQHQLWDPWPKSEVIGGLAMSRKTLSAPDRQRLRSALASMVRDGTVKRAVEQHFGSSLSGHYRWISAPATAP